MRPNSEEVLRGVAVSLMLYVLPEVESAYARTQLGIVAALLGVVANDWDGSAQRLVDDNASLRTLAARAADEPASGPLRDELRALAGEADASLRLSELSASNARLRDVIAKLGALLVNDETSPLRADVIEMLHADAEARTLALVGPRSDG